METTDKEGLRLLLGHGRPSNLKAAYSRHACNVNENHYH